MKRALILLSIVTLFLLTPAVGMNQALVSQHNSNNQVNYEDGVLVSEAGGTGNSVSNLAYMTTTISGLSMGIYNSYADSSHQYTLDLSSYQRSGWTLDNVEISATSIIAAPEHVSHEVDISGYSNSINIENDTAGTSLTTDALYQEFYNLPHDGRLENYSIVTKVEYYLPSQLGYAYMVVRDDYSSLAANVTGFISPFTQSLSPVTYTHDCSGDNAILTASTPYYVVIDGTAMVGLYSGGWWFNKIFWYSEPTNNYETGYHNWDYDVWDIYELIDQMDANLNYTYTPWNSTSSSAIQYSAAEQISLFADGSPQTGLQWSLSSASNITSIAIATTQSVDIVYDLTLRYVNNVAGTTVWNVVNSEDPVQWNVTSNLIYPTVPGTTSMYLNVSITLNMDSF